MGESEFSKVSSAPCAARRAPAIFLSRISVLKGVLHAHAIQLKDKAGSADLRAATRAAHLEYLKAHKDLLLAAGALIDDDGTGGHGGILLVDTEDRAVAQRFIDQDPFTRAGLFERITVTRWRKAFFNKEYLL